MLFREVQKFRGFWSLLIAFLSSFLLVAIYLFGMVFEPLPMPLAIVVGILMIGGAIVLLIFFYSANLTVEIRKNGLFIRFFPFYRSSRKIVPTEIADWQARTYDPLSEFGGYGIRFGFNGMAYNISGHYGVQLELINGKRLLIGTNRAEALAQAISLLKKESSR
ncbi:MAG: DUF6141 family protein [Promethearchaeota archaeon]